MLKIISLNVERSKHLDRVFPFIQKEAPDVLLLQEVLERDLSEFQKQSGLPNVVWLRDTFIDDPTNTSGQPDYSGIAILSRHPFTSQGSEYYYMPVSGIALEAKQMVDARVTNAQGVVWAAINHNGTSFTFATTHFTWTPDGYPNEDQEIDFLAAKEVLSKIGPHILTGDLNAPRGLGVWERFTALYDQDNIPADIVTTIDPDLHRFGKRIAWTVDALFTAKEYQTNDVRIVSGLSDHMAVMAQVSRR